MQAIENLNLPTKEHDMPLLSMLSSSTLAKKDVENIRLISSE